MRVPAVLALSTQPLTLGPSGRFVFGLLLLFAILFFAYSATRRVRLLLALAPEPRFDRIGLRIRKTLEYAFLQKRMFRDFYAGTFHFLIFTGFLVLTVRTTALVVEGLVPGFALLPGRAGDVYTLAKDVFEVLVLVGVAMAVFRRAFARPRRLDLTLDAWLILFLIGLLIAADLVSEGAKVALTPELASAWAPAVAVVAGLFAAATPATLQALYAGGWWVHLVDILFFGNYLPYSKHFHILTAIPNVFLMKLEPMGRLGRRTSKTPSTSGCRESSTSPGNRPSTATPAPSAGAAASSARRRSRTSRSTRRSSSASCATPCTRRRRRFSRRPPGGATAMPARRAGS